MTERLRDGGPASRVVPAVIALALGCAAAHAQETADAMLPLWRSAQAECAAGEHRDPATRAACARRDHFANRLTRAGMCYGRKAQAPAAFDWHVCGPDSNRLPSR